MVGGNTVAALLLMQVEETTLTSMCSLYMVLAIKSACKLFNKVIIIVTIVSNLFTRYVLVLLWNRYRDHMPSS